MILSRKIALDLYLTLAGLLIQCTVQITTDVNFTWLKFSIAVSVHSLLCHNGIHQQRLNSVFSV